MRKPKPSDQWPKDCQAAERDLAQELPRLHALAVQSKQWRPEYALKLIELHEWCLKNQPRTILELGSGYTTVVLSQYATEFRGKLITIEENAEWLTTVQGWIPEFARHGALVVPSVIEGDGIRYQSWPALDKIDLLYVDGPAVFGKPMPCVDCLCLVKQTDVRNLLFDMRHQSVDKFREVEGYGFEPGGSYEWSCPEYLRPRRHHSWFWRKCHDAIDL